MSPVDRRLLTHINWLLFGLTLLLFAIGLLNLYSASIFRLEDGVTVNAYYRKQFLWGLLGFGGMLAFMVLDYRYYRYAAWPLFFLSILLLAAVPVFGKVVYGAKRWLAFGAFSLQPSEIAKISMLLLGAAFLSKKPEKLDWGGLIFICAVGAGPALMIAAQPDLGSALSLLLILSGVILYRGLTPRVLKCLAVLLPALVPLGWFCLKGYQKQRILTFLDPSRDPLGSGWHIIQSQIAIGSGRMWGKGFLAGTQSQLRFLPEKHTDFALAVFGEEWGFMGMVTLLSLYCFFLLSIYITAREASDRFGSFLAAGVFFYFFWQIVINMGMVLGMMPVVGIPLPFISYGGSATLVNFCLIGLVLNVSMRRFTFKN
jgi:rod shape determining protein RodA